MKSDNPLKGQSERLTFTYEGSTSQVSSVQEDTFSDDSEALVMKHFLYGTYSSPLIEEDTCGDQFYWGKISLCEQLALVSLKKLKINAGVVQNGIKLCSKTVHSFLQ